MFFFETLYYTAFLLHLLHLLHLLRSVAILEYNIQSVSIFQQLLHMYGATIIGCITFDEVFRCQRFLKPIDIHIATEWDVSWYSLLCLKTVAVLLYFII